MTIYSSYCDVLQQFSIFTPRGMLVKGKELVERVVTDRFARIGGLAY